MKRILSFLLAALLIIAVLSSCDYHEKLSEEDAKENYALLQNFLETPEIYEDRCLFWVNGEFFTIHEGERAYYCEDETPEYLDECFASVKSCLDALKKREVLTYDGLRWLGDTEENYFLTLSPSPDYPYDSLGFTFRDDDSVEVSLSSTQDDKTPYISIHFHTRELWEQGVISEHEGLLD